jgi:NADPH:quinone reductase-like Zn-dependent oxidoreductase
MSGVEAVVVDPSQSDRLVIKELAEPVPLSGEALVRVKAISLNRGEVRRSQSAAAGWRPGWDFSGVVERAAEDGSGPKNGARVVEMLNSGSWAQKVAASVNTIVELPENVSFSQAATVPVAGLTALHALYKGGFLLGQPVLITGATGGTGDFACQLARLAGANVVATVRSANGEAFVRANGVSNVVVGDDPSEAGKFGPFRLIVDSVGGPNFSKVLAMLASHGVCVIFGTTAGAEPVINASRFYSTGSTTLYGMMIFQELQREPASVGLKNLVGLISEGKLTPHIALEDSWRKIAEVARKLTDREFLGKAVLSVD